MGGNKINGAKEAIERIDSSLEKEINFTQETTLSGSRTLKTIKRARELNYFIRLYYVGVNSADESIKRIKNCVENGGHYIPEQDVKRRYSKRFEDLAKLSHTAMKFSSMTMRTALQKKLNTKTAD